MAIPLPHRAVKGSKTGVPIMALFDLLGRKWNLRIMWELRKGPLSFRGLQAECGGLSPSVLNTRLKQLNEAKLLTSTSEGYQLTQLGCSLMVRLDPLREWSDSWSNELSD